MHEFTFEGKNVSVECEVEGAHAPHALADHQWSGEGFCLGHAGALGDGEELVIVVEELEIGAPRYADRAAGYWFTREATGGRTLYVCEDDPPQP